jgi:hypothetical protein
MLMSPSSRPISISTDDRSIDNSSIASQGSGSDTDCKPGFEVHQNVGLDALEAPLLCPSRTSLLSVVNHSLAATVVSPPLKKHTATPRDLPFVSNDSNFVASTLKQRDEQEVLRAAQAMLYEAFKQALEQQQQNQRLT